MKKVEQKSNEKRKKESLGRHLNAFFKIDYSNSNKNI